jgi:hypothetical protein
MWDPPGSSFPVKIFVSVDELNWVGIIMSCDLFLMLPSVNLTLPMMHESEAKIFKIRTNTTDLAPNLSTQ